MKTILIVDDEPSYRKVLSVALKKQGYNVLLASDGVEGLKSAINDQPDLIILDIKMPNMDGVTMLKQLRDDPYGKKLKVIMFTNLEPDPEIIQNSLQNIPAYYLIKSNTNLKELVDKIKELLDEGEGETTS